MTIQSQVSNPVGYLGNNKLKRPGVDFTFTPEQKKEFIKCLRSAEYFLENYVRITTVDPDPTTGERIRNFKPYKYQKKMIKTFNDHRYTICKLPRQSGKSTVVIGYIIWLVLFTERYTVGILANKDKTARELLRRLKDVYENLPKWIQQGVITWNKGDIELENGSRVITGATSSSSIRGNPMNLVFLDEFAHISSELAEEFFESVYPTISSGESSKMIIVSTPLGMNHFYKMWVEAKENRSDFIPIEISWNDVPGRNEAWKREQIRNIGEQKFAQEFATEFVGGTHTLIDGVKLRQLVWKDPVKKNNSLDIHEAPQKGSSYVLVADTSRGVGLDYSAFIVVDVTKYPYRLVAKYRDAHVSPYFYPEVILSTARAYNEAQVLVESNDIGEAIARAIYDDHGYENIIYTTLQDRKGTRISAGFGSSARPGIRTTKSVKAIGCSNLKALIESDKLLIEDFEMIRELANFITDGKTYAAQEGEHDDLVMCAVLFAWMTGQDYFKALTDSDLRAHLINDGGRNLEETVLPFILDHDMVEEDDVGGMFNGSSF